MVELSIEVVVVLFVVCLAVAISSSAWLRSMLLAIFGILGVALIAIGVVVFLIRSGYTHSSEFVHIEFPASRAVEVHQIPLTDIEARPSKSSETRALASKTVIVKKPVSAPAPAVESTAIEDLPVRAAEPIRIDDQTRAEIEQQWREGQLHDRLIYTGTGAATLICLLATLFGYLKLDLLSQAKHRRGLQAGAAGVILAVALVAALAAEGRLGF
jgi:hypothetical protein